MSWNIIDLIIHSIPILTGLLGIVVMPFYIYYGAIYGKKYGYLNANKRRLFGMTPIVSLILGFVGFFAIWSKFMSNNYFVKYIIGLKSFFN
jgi:hypothetical protein